MSRAVSFDHVQVAIPRGAEDKARGFYGALLGLEEIPKPTLLAARGGVWYRCGDLQLHLGVENDFRAAQKAHPAFRVTDLAALRAALKSAGCQVTDDGIDVNNRPRLFTADPFGNRVELIESF